MNDMFVIIIIYYYIIVVIVDWLMSLRIASILLDVLEYLSVLL